MRRAEVLYVWKSLIKEIGENYNKSLANASYLTLPGAATKNRSALTVPLNRRARQAILILATASNRPLSLHAVTTKFRRLCHRCGIRGRFHDLRHSFATRLAESAAKPQRGAISRLLNQKSLALADRVYTHFSLEYLQEVTQEAEG